MRLLVETGMVRYLRKVVFDGTVVLVGDGMKWNCGAFEGCTIM